MSPPPIVASSRRLVSSPLSARRLVLLVVPFFVPPSSRLIRRLVSSFLASEGAVFACSPLFVSVPSSSLVPFVVPFSVSPSSRPPSRCRLIPVPVSFVVQAFRFAVVPVSRLIRRPVSAIISSAAHCRLVRRSVLLVARRLVPFSSRRRFVHRPARRRSVPRPVRSSRRSSSARPPSPFPRQERRGVFFSRSMAGGQASKGAGRRRAGDGLGRAGRVRGIAIGRSCDWALASKQAGHGPQI